MRIRKKLVVAVILTVITLFTVIYFLPDIGYVIFFKNPKIEVVSVKGKSIEGDIVNLLATIKVTNQASLTVTLKKAIAAIYYEGVFLGEAQLNNPIQIPASSSIDLDVIVKVNSQSDTLKKLIKDILYNSKSNLNYNIKALVSASFLGLFFEKEVEIKDSITIYLSTFVKVIGWNVSIANLKVISGSNNTLSLLVQVSAVNLSDLDVTIEKADISVYYKNNLIGKGELQDSFEIKSQEKKLVNVLIDITNFDLLRNSIYDLVTNKEIYFDYSVILKVYSHYYLLETDYNITGRLPYRISDIISDIAINKIIIDEKNAYIIASFTNTIGIDFHVDYINSIIYFNNRAIGYVNYRLNRDIPSNSSITASLPLILNENATEALKQLIEKGSLSASAMVNATIRVFDFSTSINFELNRTISLTFTLDSSLSSVRYLTPNILEVSVNLLASSKDDFDATFILNNAVFDAYYNGTYIGRALIDQASILSLNKPTQIKVRINVLGNDLKYLLEGIINNKTLEIQLKNAFFNLQFANKTFGVTLNKDISVKLSPFIFDINISNPKIIEVSTTSYQRTLMLKVYVEINVSKIYNLPITINSIFIEVNEQELGKIGRIFINNPLYIYSNGSITDYFNIELVKDKISTLIAKALERGYVQINLSKITLNIEILGSQVSLNLSKSFDLRLSTPVSFTLDAKLVSLNLGDAPKSFSAAVSVNVGVSGMSIRNVDLINATAQLYLNNTFLGSATTLINQRVISVPFSYAGQVKLIIEDQGASEIAKYILQQKPIKITIKNVSVSFRILNETYLINLPKKMIFNVTINPDIKIFITNFTIKPPGNIVDADVEVSSSVINVQLTNVGEVSADLYGINNIYYGSMKIISIYNYPNLIFKGVAELKLAQDGLNNLASSITMSNVISFFAKNFKFSSTINGVNVVFNSNESYLVQVSTNFSYDYDFSITDINALPPGTIFPITISINYNIRNGVNTPFTILSAEMDIYNSTETYLGKATVKGPIQITQMSGSLSFVANFNINPSTAPWFASQIVNYGKVTFKLANIVAKVQIYDYIVNVPIKGLTYTYVTQPIEVIVESINITSISISPLQVYAVATVSINNPFNFPVMITYIQGSDKTIIFDIVEAQSEAHPGRYLGYGYYTNQQLVNGKARVTLYPVNVVVTDPLHLVSPPHGSLIPPSVSIYVDAVNGKAGMKIYDLYFTFSFEKRNIYVKYP